MPSYGSSSWRLLLAVPHVVVRHNTQACKCCKKKRASMGCQIASCTYICHYPCAIDSGGEFVDNVGFYCPSHVNLAKKSKKSPL
jgi:hypothetical protein